MNMQETNTDITPQTGDPWEEIRALLRRVTSGLEQPEDARRESDDILHARARSYAREAVEVHHDLLERDDLVLFTLGSDSYGIDCGQIEEVIPLQNLVALPFTNKGILGISSLRGLLFAVVDLKRILNIPASELTTMHRVLMIRHDSYKVGFLVDSVQGMRSFNRSELQELPAEVHDRSRAYLHGLAKDNVLLLNAAKVLEDTLVTGVERSGK
ncbi:MAG: purine-binding chemotaxis protein CheW [Bacteroidetes bacterium]|nr:purine-binding chemotaxis protein CheW [Bacteroidota bacterium]